MPVHQLENTEARLNTEFFCYMLSFWVDCHQSPSLRRSSSVICQSICRNPISRGIMIKLRPKNRNEQRGEKSSRLWICRCNRSTECASSFRPTTPFRSKEDSSASVIARLSSCRRLQTQGTSTKSCSVVVAVGRPAGSQTVLTRKMRNSGQEHRILGTSKRVSHLAFSR